MHYILNDVTGTDSWGAIPASYNGWGEKVLNEYKAMYGEILTTINNNCHNLIKAPKFLKK